MVCRVLEIILHVQELTTLDVAEHTTLVQVHTIQVTVQVRMAQDVQVLLLAHELLMQTVFLKHDALKVVGFHLPSQLSESTQLVSMLATKSEILVRLLQLP